MHMTLKVVITIIIIIIVIVVVVIIIIIIIIIMLLLFPELFRFPLSPVPELPAYGQSSTKLFGHCCVQTARMSSKFNVKVSGCTGAVVVGDNASLSIGSHATDGKCGKGASQRDYSTSVS